MGRFLVWRLTDEPEDDPAAAARALAAATGWPPVDAAARLRRPGWMLECSDEAEGRRLAAVLARAGCPAFAAPEEEFEEPPLPLRAARFAPDGARGFRVLVRQAAGESEFARPWTEVAAAWAGRIEEARRAPVAAGEDEPPAAEAAAPPGGGATGLYLGRRGPRWRRESKVDFVMELVVERPRGRLRLELGGLHYPAGGPAGEGGLARDNFPRLAAAVAAGAPQAHLGRGVRQLAECGLLGDWRGLTFAGRDEFEAYGRWQWQLARRRRPAGEGSARP